MLRDTGAYLRGYLVIAVSGFSMERFVNLAVHRGIKIWDAERSDGYIKMKIAVKSFRLLKPCAKKTGCKIQILERRGLPFLIFKYRKRKFLAIGILFFIAMLYFLSSFVWQIEVEGAKRVNSAAVLEFLSQNGLKSGSFKYKVPERDLERALLLNFGDISWVNVEIKGTRARVRLTETIPKTELVDRSTPCDVAAKKDGIIISVAASAGKVLVKPGDTVIAGEILVSSEITAGTPEDGIIMTSYVHADARVEARVFYELVQDAPFQYARKEYTGNTGKDRGFIFFGKEINLINYGIPYAAYDRIRTDKQFNFGNRYPLPLSFVTYEYREFIMTTETRTVDAALETARALLDRRIVRELELSAEVVDKKYEYEILEDRVRLRAVITAIERIDEQRIWVR